jgi:hypothetical protein
LTVRGGAIVDAGADVQAGPARREIVRTILEVVVDVAVERALLEPALVQRAGELGRVGKEVAAVERQHLHLVAGLVGAREDRLPAILEERLRGEAVADEVGIGHCQTHVPLEVAASLADLREELLDVRRRVVAPAVLVEPRACGVRVKAVLEAATGLELSDEALRPARTRARHRCVSPLRRNASAPPRVFRPNRVRPRNGVMLSERRLRNQVPVDDIGERGVDSNPSW